MRRLFPTAAISSWSPVSRRLMRLISKNLEYLTQDLCQVYRMFKKLGVKAKLRTLFEHREQGPIGKT